MAEPRVHPLESPSLVVDPRHLLVGSMGPERSQAPPIARGSIPSGPSTAPLPALGRRPFSPNRVGLAREWLVQCADEIRVIPGYYADVWLQRTRLLWLRGEGQ